MLLLLIDENVENNRCCTYDEDTEGYDKSKFHQVCPHVYFSLPFTIIA
jgi:hypothetical protein